MSQFRNLVRISVSVALLVAISPAPGWADATRDWLEQNLPPLIELYRHLHRTPELSFQEEHTAARMAAELREVGADVTERVGGFGVVGVLRNGPGKTLMLRTDLDALPVVEQTGLPYASKVRTTDRRGATVGVMHACGHDLHMTNLVGVAQYLAANRDRWSGTCVFICQPAEERGAGAEAMLQDGLYQRFPRPDYALALHVTPQIPAGKVGYRAGYSMANVDSVDVKIRGRGGHGAYPHTTIDPVVIAARYILDLQTIISREVKPIEPAVITVGSIRGGTKHNIIGDDCHLQLTVRSYSPAVRRQLLAAIERKAKAAALSAEAPPPTVEVSEGTPALFNDEQLVSRLVPALQKALGEKNVFETEPVMGGEDFSRFVQGGVPIMLLWLGGTREARLDQFTQTDSQPPSLHSPLFYPDVDAALPTGIIAMASAALDLLPPKKQDGDP